MPTHYQLDTETIEKKQLIIDYGGPEQYRNRFPIKSYKEQALVELASRLILEDQIKELGIVREAAVDILDGVFEDEIRGFTGLPLERCAALRKKIMG